jgi:hypothetical protein
MNMNSIRCMALALGVAAALALSAGCKKRSTPVNVAFPQTNEVSGWTKSGETRTFASTELSNYIDGDAEKYLKAGVRSTSTADYKFSDQTQVTADIYTMSTAGGAKTIFDSEPAGDAKSAAVGDAARLYSQSLVFRKGPYLVQIVAYQTSPQLQQAMLDLGHGIEKKLLQ